MFTGPAKSAESDATKNFIANYTKANGFAPDSFATNAYDGAALLILAMEKGYKETGKLDRAAIRDAFAATKDYVGASGTINFAPNGDLVAAQGVYRVENKAFKYIGTYVIANGKLAEVK